MELKEYTLGIYNRATNRNFIAIVKATDEDAARNQPRPESHSVEWVRERTAGHPYIGETW